MNRPAQMARILNGAYSDLAKADAFPPVPMPMDVSDAALFPEFAEARAHLASLSPERRAELERDWA